MKFTIVTILTALAATVVAGPIPEEDAQGTATATFHGAADAQFKQAFRLNGKNTRIHNDLSISKISVHGGSSCVFYGVDGSVTSVGNGKTVDVGPPQTQTRGHCT